MKIYWSKLRFWHQLAISHAFLTLATVFALGFFVYHYGKHVIIMRGFDLLTVSNKDALNQFKELSEELLALTRNCPTEADIGLKRLLDTKGTLPLAAVTPMAGSLKFVRGPQQEFFIQITLPCLVPKMGTNHFSIRTLSLSRLFTDRSGLGESGETYMVNLSGELLTESRFTSAPQPASIPTPIEEQWRGLKRDYRGIPVFAVWQRVRIANFEGFIASEIDEEEILRPFQAQGVGLAIASAIALIVILALVGPLAKVFSHNLERQRELSESRIQALFDGGQAERNRIALELHDNLGQILTALKWNMAASKEEKPDTRQWIQELNRITEYIRSFSRDLSGEQALDGGFHEALLDLLVQTKSTAAKHGLDLDFVVAGEEYEYKKLSDAKALSLYRIMQELLTNLLKHSKASACECRILLKGGELSIDLKDNGIGAALDDLILKGQNQNSGIGLNNVALRVKSFGGEINIDSKPGEGFHLMIGVPV